MPPGRISRARGSRERGRARGKGRRTPPLPSLRAASAMIVIVVYVCVLVWPMEGPGAGERERRAAARARHVPPPRRATRVCVMTVCVCVVFLCGMAGTAGCLCVGPPLAPQDRRAVVRWLERGAKDAAALGRFWGAGVAAALLYSSCMWLGMPGARCRGGAWCAPGLSHPRTPRPHAQPPGTSSLRRELARSRALEGATSS